MEKETMPIEWQEELSALRKELEELREIRAPLEKQYKEKMKKYQTEKDTLSARIAKAEEEKKIAMSDTRYKKPGYIAIAFLVVAAIGLWRDSLFLLVSGLIVAAIFGIVYAVKHHSYSKDISYYSSMILKFSKEMNSLGMEDAEIAELVNEIEEMSVKISAREYEIYHFEENKLAEQFEDYITNRFGNSVIFVHADDTAVFHHAIGGSKEPVSKELPAEVTVYIDGAERAVGASPYAMIGVGSGVHSLSFKCDLPSSYRWYKDVYFDLPNGGCYKSKTVQFSLDSRSGRYFVFKEFDVVNTLSYEYERYSDFRTFIKDAGISQKEFMNSIRNT